MTIESASMGDDSKDDSKWPYVAGFTTQPKEFTAPRDCQVTGQIPKWLSGELYRVGPGLYEVARKDGSQFQFHHWFDGLTLLHRFTIDDQQRVLYQSKFTATGQQNTIESGSTPLTFGQNSDYCQSLFSRTKSSLRRLGTAASSNIKDVNVGVTVSTDFLTPEGPRLVLKTDGNFLQPVDHDTLEPQPLFTYTDMNPEFSGFLSAAHEEWDHEEKSYFNFTVLPGPMPKLHLFTINASNPSGKLLARIPLDAVPYAHSFASTKRYIVWIQYPIEIGWSGAKLLWEGCFTKSFQWRGDKEVKFHVVERGGGGAYLGAFTCPAFFVFHSINAFDDDVDDVVIDLAAYPDASCIECMSLDNLRRADGKAKLDNPYIKRFRLKSVRQSLTASDAKKKKPEAQLEFTVDQCPMELPQINPVYKYRPDYRYVYGISSLFRDKHQHVFSESLAKVDLRTKSFVSWSEPGCTPGEPIFLPDPTAASGKSGEDAGVLLSVVLDGKKGKSFLLILDARTMKEIARAGAPAVVPFGFHGAWKPRSTNK